MPALNEKYAAALKDFKPPENVKEGDTHWKLLKEEEQKFLKEYHRLPYVYWKGREALIFRRNSGKITALSAKELRQRLACSPKDPVQQHLLSIYQSCNPSDA